MRWAEGEGRGGEGGGVEGGKNSRERARELMPVMEKSLMSGKGGVEGRERERDREDGINIRLGDEKMEPPPRSAVLIKISEPKSRLPHHGKPIMFRLERENLYELL